MRCRLLLLSDLFRIDVFVLDDVWSVWLHSVRYTCTPRRHRNRLRNDWNTSLGAVLLRATPLPVAFEMLLNRWSAAFGIVR